MTDLIIKPNLGPPSRILDWLYLGTLRNAIDLSISNPLEIRRVLNCTDDSSPIDAYTLDPSVDVDSHLQLDLLDGQPVSVETLKRAISYLEYSSVHRLKTLVCCHAGRSRSPGIVLAYLLSRGMQYNLALKLIIEARNIVFIHPKIDLSVRQAFGLAPRSAADFLQANELKM